MAHIGLKRPYVPHLHQVHYLTKFLVIMHEHPNQKLHEANPSQACHHIQLLHIFTRPSHKYMIV